ncbi:MAG: polyketide cyclase [Bacteroidetes bacterium]|nr:polyketide cyclase [Bacteroidota bacterium]
MTEYVSKQVAINKPDSMIYMSLSNFDNFSPMLKDKVEGWQATVDNCSFKLKGFTLKLKMLEKEPCKTIKISGDDIPFEFYFWVQLHQVAEGDTRMRLTIHAKLNKMMKMMIGKKLQKGVDEMANQIANSFNNI